MGLIQSSTEENRGEKVQMVKLKVKEPELRAMLERIGQYLKTTYARSLKGVLDVKNVSVNLDFPFLSRL